MLSVWYNRAEERCLGHGSISILYNREAHRLMSSQLGGVLDCWCKISLFFSSSYWAGLELSNSFASASWSPGLKTVLPHPAWRPPELGEFGWVWSVWLLDLSFLLVQHRLGVYSEGDWEFVHNGFLLCWVGSPTGRVWWPVNIGVSGYYVISGSLFSIQIFILTSRLLFHKWQN